MDTGKVVKESKTFMVVTLITGVILLAVGTLSSWMDIGYISNPKAVVGLSFIPLSVAFAYYIKISMIKRSPQKMKAIMINENDERLTALKNEAEAKAFKIIQGALFLTYMGYTLMVPADIFESVGWWLLMILLLISFISQGIMSEVVAGKNISEDSDE